MIIEIISKGCEDCVMIIIHKRTQHVVWHVAELNRHQFPCFILSLFTLCYNSAPHPAIVPSHFHFLDISVLRGSTSSLLLCAIYFFLPDDSLVLLATKFPAILVTLHRTPLPPVVSSGNRKGLTSERHHSPCSLMLPSGESSSVADLCGQWNCLPSSRSQKTLPVSVMSGGK